MGREFTVYGLRFSKTSFWNHVNTGFLDPAVATALTACGIETRTKKISSDCSEVATALTACGIETKIYQHIINIVLTVRLQQRLPLAVLKQSLLSKSCAAFLKLQQRLPLAVLKRSS